MEKIGWTDRVRNVVRNVVNATNRRKANWIGHILRGNYILKHVTEGMTEVTRRRGRR